MTGRFEFYNRTAHPAGLDTTGVSCTPTEINNHDDALSREARRVNAAGRSLVPSSTCPNNKGSIEVAPGYCPGHLIAVAAATVPHAAVTHSRAAWLKLNPPPTAAVSRGDTAGGGGGGVGNGVEVNMRQPGVLLGYQSLSDLDPPQSHGKPPPYKVDGRGRV